MKTPFVCGLLLMLAGVGVLFAPSSPWGMSRVSPPPPVLPIEILSTDGGDAVARKVTQLYARGLAHELRELAPRVGSPEFQGGFGPAGAAAFTPRAVAVLQSSVHGFDLRVSALDQTIAEAQTPADKVTAVETLRTFFLDYARELERIGR